jgi:hypothetical protein
MAEAEKEHISKGVEMNYDLIAGKRGAHLNLTRIRRKNAMRRVLILGTRLRSVVQGEPLRI